MPRTRRSFSEGFAVEGFVIQKHIGHGGYGEIYSAIQQSNGSIVAMKFERLDAQHRGLEQEIGILTHLQGCHYFPKILAQGSTTEFRFFAMTLLGISLSNMRRLLPERKYNLPTVLRLSLEMLNAIEAFHARGYIHRDIKPGNYLLRPSRTRPVCLIDYGLSQPFLVNGVHIPAKRRAGFAGTSKYCSLNGHSELQLSRRDDLLSWFYSCVELVEGKLPWSQTTDLDETEDIKKAIPVTQLSRSLPADFIRIWEYLNSLKFAKRPDYGFLRGILVELINENGGEGGRWDWEELDDETLRSGSEIPVMLRDGEPDVSEDDPHEDMIEEVGCVACAVA
jgi:serine/threonine protein kinase